MNPSSQTNHLPWLLLLAALCVLPSGVEAAAILWGQNHGLVGKALRDGLDFWAGGHLALTGQTALLFHAAAYNRFLQSLFGPLPFHLWSYPPTYLFLASAFAPLAPWHAVLAFEALSVLALVTILRLARLPWALICAVALSPAALENFLAGQNAALLTALIGGGILLLPRRPRLAGALIGLASIKPQLGIILPLFLLRRSRIAFAAAAFATLAFAAASALAFKPRVWIDFWRVTRPAMSAVLLTGQPRDFSTGLISVFAAVHPLGIPAAFAAQVAATIASVFLATRTRSPAALLLLAALACPYLHAYDLLGTTLAIALLIQNRLASGFRPCEAMLLFLAWSAPGLVTWVPALAPFIPLLLVSILARATLPGCDSNLNARASSAGRSPIPAPPASTANG